MLDSFSPEPKATACAHRHAHHARRWLAAKRLLILALLAAGGCGSSDSRARYTVTGKVTYQGQSVEEGTITFENPSAGQVNSSPLGSGGSYSLDVPAGDYKVSVSPPLVETKGTGDSPPDMVPKKVNNI